MIGGGSGRLGSTSGEIILESFEPEQPGLGIVNHAPRNCCDHYCRCTTYNCSQHLSVPEEVICNKLHSTRPLLYWSVTSKGLYLWLANNHWSLDTWCLIYSESVTQLPKHIEVDSAARTKLSNGSSRRPILGRMLIGVHDATLAISICAG